MHKTIDEIDAVKMMRTIREKLSEIYATNREQQRKDLEAVGQKYGIQNSATQIDRTEHPRGSITLTKP